MFAGVTNHVSLSGTLMDESRFSGYRDKCKAWWGDYCVSVLFRTWTPPLSSIEVTLISHMQRSEYV